MDEYTNSHYSYFYFSYVGQIISKSKAIMSVAFHFDQEGVKPPNVDQPTILILEKRQQMLAVVGISLISIAFLLTLIISSTQPGLSWPPTFSNLLADTTTPQARLFFTLGFLAGICLLQSWILFLPPQGKCEAFRHFAFCVGLVIISTIPTSTNRFRNFQSDDIWEFTLHMIGVVLTFVIHPVYELLGTTEYGCSVNKYRTDRGKGRIRFWFSFTSLILTFMFVVLMIAQGVAYQDGMHATLFSIECVLITLLLADAWFIVLNERELRRDL